MKTVPPFLKQAGRVLNSGQARTLLLTGNINDLFAPAADDQDYVPLLNTVTIPAGAASTDIDVVPLDDALFESNETVTMSIAPDPDYLAGVPSTATVVVTSDDLPPDLVVASLTVPTKAGAGAAINVSDTTRNQGQGPAGSSTTALHLSTDGTLDAADTLYICDAAYPLQGTDHDVFDKP